MTSVKQLPVGIVCADGIEQREVLVPRKALHDAGFEVELISPGGEPIRGYNYIDPGEILEAQVPLAAARADHFSCLVLPGGLGGPDSLRKNPEAVNLVRSYWELGRPVATICHGPWLLIEAAALRHRTLTCADQITTDVINAGACYVDEEAYVDDGRQPLLVSGRNHEAVKQFADVMVRALSGVGEPSG